LTGAVIGAGGMYLATRKIGPFGPLLKGFGGSEMPDLKNALGVHVRQIRRYAFASSQDRSPIVGLTHASYALILLETLEEIVGTEAISRAGYDPRKLKKFIVGLQDMHAKQLEAQDPFLTAMLNIERGESPDVAPGVVSGSEDSPWAAPTGA